ncbi:uncharacterized protein LOC112560221 isoform X3 [Pomacea canaliculata]|nr:uncharacterized protein LOC112560221 isoform X3 [Pomacea canaliculata]XP_025087681.1 uncharacterized protein LOC112560221 isoform X3 [Pomacea canaliculata]XP_025087682.1 uncharacterized protein LOC112560221 isoform X3 [Pomacea canaliculata]XP_025087683.1 uncharacterized protein LOC112560221 isoform X3 [Pomacea canaliculata]
MDSCNKRRSVAAVFTSQASNISQGNTKAHCSSMKPPIGRRHSISGSKRALSKIEIQTSCKKVPNKENSNTFIKDHTKKVDFTDKLDIKESRSEKQLKDDQEKEEEIIDKTEDLILDTPNICEQKQIVNCALKLYSSSTTPTSKKRRISMYRPSDLVVSFPRDSISGETLKLHLISPTIAENPLAINSANNGPKGNEPVALTENVHIESETGSQQENAHCKLVKSSRSTSASQQCSTDSSVLLSKAAVTNAPKIGSCKTPRFSYSAQFLKSKRRSVPTTLAHGQTSGVKLQSHQGLQAPNFCHLQKSVAEKTPSRSILKRRSYFWGEVKSHTDSGDSVPTDSKDQALYSEAKQDDGLPASRWQDGKVEACDQQHVGKSSSHVTFASDVESKKNSSTFRKTPLTIRDHRNADPVRHKPNEWMACKHHTHRMRHISCFLSQNPKEETRLRLQLKPSMTVKQLSEQEDALVEEELRTNLLEKFESRDSVDLSLYNFSSSPLIGASHEDKTKDDNDELKKETDVIAEMGEMGKDKEVHVEKAVQEMNLEENDRDSDEKSESPGVDKGREEMSDSTDINDLSRLDVDFDKCLAAVEEGLLSSTDAIEWLDAVADSFCNVKHSVKWYQCRVAALRMSGDTDRLLATFEEAIINDVQTRVKLASLVTETMKKLLSSGRSLKKGRYSVATPNCLGGSTSKRRSTFHHVPLEEVQQENVFESTTVKYSVVEVTPFKKRRRLTEEGDRLVSVITPVRRSARLIAAQTKSVSEKRPPRYQKVYSTLKDIPKQEKECMLFQPNKALNPILSSADNSCLDQDEEIKSQEG